MKEEYAKENNIYYAAIWEDGQVGYIYCIYKCAGSAAQDARFVTLAVDGSHPRKMTGWSPRSARAPKHGHWPISGAILEGSQVPWVPAGVVDDGGVSAWPQKTTSFLRV